MRSFIEAASGAGRMAAYNNPGLRRPIIGLTGAAILVLAGLVTWARWPPLGASKSNSQGRRDIPENPSLVLVVSGDTAGWIVPCGCASNQSGGLPRRGSFVADRGRK